MSSSIIYFLQGSYKQSSLAVLLFILCLNVFTEILFYKVYCKVYIAYLHGVLAKQHGAAVLVEAPPKKFLKKMLELPTFCISTCIRRSLAVKIRLLLLTFTPNKM